MSSEGELKLNSDGKVFYISPYLPDEEKYKSHYSPAAQSKAEYIRSKLKKYGAVTVCVNCSLTVDDSVYMPRTMEDENGTCMVLFSKSSVHRFLLPVCGAIMLMSVFFYVLFRAGRKDTVVLYHSIYYDRIVIFLKKLKRFRLIYEVEEIYADVRDGGAGREAEICRCNQAADAFIFPTELLDEAVNEKHKKSVIIYGAYNPLKKAGLNSDNKISVVYSGTLMAGKGAAQAVACAEALDGNYEVRIIGYGSPDEIQEIKGLVDANTSACRVVYDGMKQGKGFADYLMACDIGLCIQPGDSIFNETSFPSKILAYLNCGLKVVATEMEALKKSKLAGYMIFSEGSSPAEVAKAIKRASEIEIDNYKILQELDREVSEGISDILET